MKRRNWLPACPSPILQNDAHQKPKGCHSTWPLGCLFPNQVRSVQESSPISPGSHPPEPGQVPHSRALRCTTLPATKFLHGCPCRSCARHSANLQGVPHETTDRRPAAGTHRPAFAGRFPALKRLAPYQLASDTGPKRKKTLSRQSCMGAQIAPCQPRFLPASRSRGSLSI